MYTGSDPQTRAGPAPELANHYAGEDDVRTEIKLPTFHLTDDF